MPPTRLPEPERIAVTFDWIVGQAEAPTKTAAK